MVSAKAIGSSGDHSDLVVEAFGGAVGDLAFGSEPIEDEFFVRAEHAGDFAHGLDAAAEGALSPDTQKGAGPSDGTVAPKVVEALLEHPCPAGGQFAAEELMESEPGFAPDAAAPAQQFPAHAFELGRLGLAAQAGALGAADLIDRLVEMRGDVEAVKDVKGVAGLGGDDLEVGFPHVAANKTDPAHHFLSEGGEAPAQSALRATRADPKQAAAVAVDLVDDGQEVVRAHPVAPVDLVKAEGFDPFEDAMGQAPLDEPVHRTVHGFPTGMKRPGGFAPRHASSPAGQEHHHRDRDWALALAPGDVLDGNAVLGAFDSTRGVVESRRDVPQGREEPGPCGQAIIPRRAFQADGALAVDGGMGFQMDVNLQGATVLPEPDLPVNETDKVLNPIQNGLNLELNSWSPGWLFFTNRCETTSDHRRPAISFTFFPHPASALLLKAARALRRSGTRSAGAASFRASSSRRPDGSGVNKSAADLFKRPQTCPRLSNSTKHS